MPRVSFSTRHFDGTCDRSWVILDGETLVGQTVEQATYGDDRKVSGTVCTFVPRDRHLQLARQLGLVGLIEQNTLFVRRTILRVLRRG